MEGTGNVSQYVAPGGTLHIAMYNDQGRWSEIWTLIKRTYNALPALLRPAFAVAVMIPREIRSFLIHLLRGVPLNYFRNIWNYSESSQRGMNWWNDQIDWIGGYPFEVSMPEQILDILSATGISSGTSEDVPGWTWMQ